MTYIVSCYFSPVATYGCSKHAKTLAVVLTVPAGQDSGVLDDHGFLTWKKQVRIQEQTEIAHGNAGTASALVECEPCECEN